MAEELERIYTIPLGDAYAKPRAKRAKVAVKILRSFISRHMKAGEESVSISGAVNSAIWESGMKKPPRKLKVIANRDKEGKVKVTLTGEKEEQAKATEQVSKRKEEKKKKTEAKKAAPKEKGEPGKADDSKPEAPVEKAKDGKQEAKKKAPPSAKK